MYIHQCVWQKIRLGRLSSTQIMNNPFKYLPFPDWYIHRLQLKGLYGQQPTGGVPSSHSIMMELQEASGRDICQNISWRAGPTALVHVRAGGGRLVLERHLGLHMGTMLIHLANGIERGLLSVQRCDRINLASNNTDTKESIRRELQFSGWDLAEGDPCGSLMKKPQRSQN